MSDQQIDLFCGRTVDPAKTVLPADHAGVAYHFCSGGCRTKFITDAAAYLTDKLGTEPVVAPEAIWTCPMHAQIRKLRPGIMSDARVFCGEAIVAVNLL